MHKEISLILCAHIDTASSTGTDQVGRLKRSNHRPKVIMECFPTHSEFIPFSSNFIYYNYWNGYMLPCCGVICRLCSFQHPPGVSLNLSQPAAALQSQKAQTSVLPIVQPQNNSNQAAAPQKQVHPELHWQTEELFQGSISNCGKWSGDQCGGKQQKQASPATHNACLAFCVWILNQWSSSRKCCYFIHSSYHFGNCLIYLSS